MEQEIAQGDCGRPMQLQDVLVDPAESPYDAVLHEENRARVENALRQVPEPFRTTLVLRDIEGFVYEEVAAMQGINLGTVKSRLVRGRAFLKALLTVERSGSRPTALAGMKISVGEGAP
jgi:RNA polymerase sigma-70 factor (ECF subfamily)